MRLCAAIPPPPSQICGTHAETRAHTTMGMCHTCAHMHHVYVSMLAHVYAHRTHHAQHVCHTCAHMCTHTYTHSTHHAHTQSAFPRHSSTSFIALHRCHL